MTIENKYEVPIEKLRKVCCSEKELRFCSTSLDVAPFEEVIGQDRAVKSMKFGLSMDDTGYNIFIVGPQGTGKGTYAQVAAIQAAKERTISDDWCYLYNFSHPDEPLSVSLPAGKGSIFKKDMDELTLELKATISKAFEEGNYKQQKETFVQNVRGQLSSLLQNLEQEAKESGFRLEQVPGRMVIVPTKDGEAYPPEEYEKLSIEERKTIEKKMVELQKKMDETIYSGQILEKQYHGDLLELDRKLVTQTTKGPIEKLMGTYKESSKIVEYLKLVLLDIIENYNDFKNFPWNENQNGKALPADAMNGKGVNKMVGSMGQEEMDPFVKYKVNLFIDNANREEAPVVVESNPNYYNLIGKMEYRNQLFSIKTDFTMLKPGAIQKANGGYLILQAKDLLKDPLAWDVLKKALKYREAVIENLGEKYVLVPTASIKPEPIPLNLKVILIGTPIYYSILSQDEDFQKLFKVKVEFDMDMIRSNDNIRQYVSFVNSICQQNQLKPFNRAALGKIIEFGSRISGDQGKLSTRFNDVSELVYESAALAKRDKAEFVDSKHVQRAIEERRFRLNRLEEKIQGEILKGRIIIDTEGSVVGQINGLSVLQLSEYSFGLPSRITARTYMGRGGIINIERETSMSGSIHSKGVLTLTGFLGGKFAQEKPLGLTAQITFEQSYQGVDGDSASSAELYAILSSLSNIPIKQSIAVTGSIDQRGFIQPIGGVTEKIEGFFDICRGKGLTGSQGVMIPIQNVENLMLKEEVLEAVQNQQFTIYAVKNIEEGIEILTGYPAGAVEINGDYTVGSIFDLVNRKLHSFTLEKNVSPQLEGV